MTTPIHITTPDAARFGRDHHGHPLSLARLAETDPATGLQQLVYWCTTCNPDTDQPGQPAAVPTTTQVERAMTRALVNHANNLRNDPDARKHWRTIHRLATRLERVIDNNTPDVYCGPCDGPVVESIETNGFIKLRIVPDATCGADLFCKVDDPIISCAECGSTYDFIERWEHVSTRARDHWDRPRAIVDFLRAFGIDITFDRLKMWISRDKAEADSGRRRRAPYPPILQVAIDDDGRPVYRVGDILDRVDALARTQDGS